jgi:hypothetical protein
MVDVRIKPSLNQEKMRSHPMPDDTKMPGGTAITLSGPPGFLYRGQDFGSGVGHQNIVLKSGPSAKLYAI